MKLDENARQTSRFFFLEPNWRDLFDRAAEAESAASSVPEHSAVRLRGFVETMVKHVFEYIGLPLKDNDNLFLRLKILQDDKYLTTEILAKFHTIRKLGNKAAHNGSVSIEQAENLIEDARSLAVWFCYYVRSNIDWNSHAEEIRGSPKSITEDRGEPKAVARSDVFVTSEEHRRRLRNAASAAFKELAPEIRQLRTSISLKDAFEVELNDGQRGCVSALEDFLADEEQQVFLLRGFAGTGKTFLAAGLSEFLQAQGRSFSLAAPTGRAAKVIAGKTGQAARTIHRLIYDYGDMLEEGDEESATFKMIATVAQNNAPVNSIYIIDEASLVSDTYSESEFFRSGSGFLLKDLFAYVGLGEPASSRKIIFMGDPAQLPPVQMATPPALDPRHLRDKYGVEVSAYELTDIVRQSSDSTVLRNARSLREGISSGSFSGPEFEFDDDVVRLDRDMVSQRYMAIREHHGTEAPVIVTETNAEASEFNRAIRSKLFPGRDFVASGDRVLAAANGFCATHYIANGEILRIEQVEDAVERRSVRLRQKNDRTGETENIDVALSFRDVSVALPRADGEDLVVGAKILDDFLHGDDPRLDPIVQRALYVDFVLRHRHLARKRDRDEFRIALRSDPYFNALMLKFGYAITCHKAQGGEWPHAIIICPTRQNPRSGQFFRWLYTAITRTSDKLYLVDPPDVRLKQVGEGWRTRSEKPMPDESVGNDLPATSISRDEQVSGGTQGQSKKDVLKFWIREQVDQLLAGTSIFVEDVGNHPYRERYFLQRGEDTATVDIQYNGKDSITAITSPKPNELFGVARECLQAIVGQKARALLSDRGNVRSPDRPFLRTFHDRLTSLLADKGINVADLNEHKWNQRYTLARGADAVVVDVFYNGKNQLTKFMAINPANNPGPSLEALQRDVTAVLDSEICP